MPRPSGRKRRSSSWRSHGAMPLLPILPAKPIAAILPIIRPSTRAWKAQSLRQPLVFISRPSFLSAYRPRAFAAHSSRCMWAREPSSRSKPKNFEDHHDARRAVRDFRRTPRGIINECRAERRAPHRSWHNLASRCLKQRRSDDGSDSGLMRRLTRLFIKARPPLPQQPTCS